MVRQLGVQRSFRLLPRLAEEPIAFVRFRPAVQGLHRMASTSRRSAGRTILAQIRSEDTVLPWLQSLQQQMVETQQFDYSSLVDIQQWSDVPRGQALFETTFGLDNVVTDSTSPNGLGLAIKNYRLVDWTTFP